MNIPVYADVEKAHQIVRKYAHRTPVLTSAGINKMRKPAKGGRF
jgi:threonine dehydratase